MKYSKEVNKNNILLALFAICTFIYSNNLKAQNHGTGAIFLSAAEYAIIITKPIQVGGDAVGYYTINSSTTQNILVNGSGSYITAQRGQFVSINFSLTVNNLSNIKWSYDNVTGNSNSFSAGFYAPQTGYTYLYKTINLDAVSPCGVLHNYYPFTIMSLGWSYAIIASPNPASGAINIAISQVADTTSSSAKSFQSASLSPVVADNNTRLYLYDINTSLLVKQWTFSENISLNYNLNIIGVKSGVYVLKMKRDNKTTNTKVIIQ